MMDQAALPIVRHLSPAGPNTRDRHGLCSAALAVSEGEGLGGLSMVELELPGRQ